MITLEQRDRSILIVPCIPLGIHNLINAYHQELMNRVRLVTLYYELKSDRVLFEAFEPYYRAIAQHLPEPFDPAELTALSRHRFFVATESVPHPTNPKAMLPGLSQLEQLLGYSYTPPVPQEKRQGPPKAEISTGDRILDLIVDAYIVFEDAAPSVIDRYDAGAIARMITQKLERVEGEKALERKQAALDKQWFVDNEAVMMSLASQRGDFPHGN